MSNLDKRWHGNDLSFVQCTNHHWRDLMPLSALSRIKHIDYIITSLHGELNIITTLLELIGHLLELQIVSNCPLK